MSQQTVLNFAGIVFIDRAVADFQILAAGVKPGYKVVILESSTDGVLQITDILQRYKHFHNVHIVSHGSPGCLYLGNTQLSLDTLDKYAPQLQHWLVENLLLYGCNIAAGDAGEEFIARLHTISKAKIAASTQRVGYAAKGGVWNLDYRIADIKPELALLPAVQQAYTATFEPLNADDYAALKALYLQTDGENWADNTGWVGWNFDSMTPPDTSVVSSWYGVELSGDRVISLFLDENQLSGTIPSDLGNLLYLQDLYLGFNQLSGEIPSVLGNLTNLITLYLNDNELTGAIPSLLGNLLNLEELDLSFNQLSGEIPSVLGSLTNLIALYLNDNELTGAIPSLLGNLLNLEELDLSFNQLSGEIPSVLGSLTNLIALYLNDNELTGAIPSVLGNLLNLEELDLSFNQLSGEIPSVLGSLTNLIALYLNDNELTGAIPSLLGNLLNLEELDLSFNQLSGEIPSVLGSLTNLIALYLNDNELTGAIPSLLGNLLNLEELDLSFNQLSGEIPSVLGSFTNLIALYLNDNELTGGIPGELANLTNLTALYLDNNLLSGELTQALKNLLATIADFNLDNPPYILGINESKKVTEDTALTGVSFSIGALAGTGNIDFNSLILSATSSNQTIVPDANIAISGTGANRSITVTPAANQSGSITITLTLQNQKNEITTESFELTIEGVNDAPTLNEEISDATATEDQAFTFTLPEGTFGDVDTGDILTYLVTLEDGSALPSWLSFNAQTLTLSGVPTNSSVGSLNIKLQVNDFRGQTASDIFTLNINADTQVSDVTQEIEDLAGDGNDDGILDSLQANVASFFSLSGSTSQDILTLFSASSFNFSYVKVTGNTAATALDNPENKNITFPIGFLDFRLENLSFGEATTVNLLVSTTTKNQAYNTYWRYGKTLENNQDHWYEFLYDGETGAEFIDTDDDGKADHIVLHFVDGKRGDSDMSANGVVTGFGAPGMSSSSLSLSQTSEEIWEVRGDAGVATAKFSLVSKNTQQVNEVGVFKVDSQNRVNGIAPGEAGFAKAALEQGEIIFSALADDLLNSVELTRSLQVGAGERLVFYLVSGSTTDAVLSQNNFANVFFSIEQANFNRQNYLQVSQTSSMFTLNWEQGGDNSFNDLVMSFELQNTPLKSQHLIGNYQGTQEGELINLESFTGQQVKATFTLYREAAYNNFVGFYKIDDAQGTITDELTGNKFKPGDEGYLELVVNQRVQGIDLSVGNMQSISTPEITVEGGFLYAPFIIANANPNSLKGDLTNVYTPFILGNFNNVDYIRILADNCFGFEDLPGGGDNDFNDMIVKVNFA
jgi:Leucine-rich repeat (LRR) protein